MMKLPFETLKAYNKTHDNRCVWDWVDTEKVNITKLQEIIVAIKTFLW